MQTGSTAGADKGCGYDVHGYGTHTVQKVIHILDDRTLERMFLKARRMQDDTHDDTMTGTSVFGTGTALRLVGIEGRNGECHKKDRRQSVLADYPRRLQSIARSA